MPLVFAGVCSHAPGIVGRADQADPDVKDKVYSAYGKMAAALAETRPDALMVVAAEHFGNFFMNNMPSFAIGMADYYEGPIEDPGWLGIERFVVPGDRDLSQRLITEIMRTSDISYAEEWKLDHGIAVPLHFLTPDYDLPVIPVNINCQGPPLAPYERVWAFGESIRRAADLVPERVAVIGTGGISHWPATPDSGKINEAWDRDFLDRWLSQRPRCAARLRRPVRLYRGRPGRLRDPNLHRGQRGGFRGTRHSALLPAGPDLRSGLHDRHLRPDRRRLIGYPPGRLLPVGLCWPSAAAWASTPSYPLMA